MKIQPFIITLLFSILIFAEVAGKEFKYKVSDIPEELMKNSKAVIRIDETVLSIKSEDELKWTNKYAITILNENGVNYSNFIKPYNKFISISSISATIFNKEGEKIRKIPNHEIFDISAISGYSIYEDVRVKVITPKYLTYPFTIEYIYEYNFKGIHKIPEWSPYPDFNIAVEKSSMKVTVPSDMEIRYYEQNIPTKLKKDSTDSNKIYLWEVANLPSLKNEPYSLPFKNFAPQVLLAPNDFSIGGVSGNMSSWKNYGMWMNKLNQDRQSLPEETQEKMLDLTKSAKNNIEKIEIVFNYLKDKTRYVSIQIGIGGWQPFEAKIVDKLGYGDCKALSNYMLSLLRTVGVNSFYTLVLAGENEAFISSDFPSSQFNHVILCVPMDNDTLWLECTSQLKPCGYPGKSTDDRDLLIIDENGGHIVHSKKYTKEENCKITKTLVKLDDSGGGTVNLSRNYIGLYYDEISEHLREDDVDQKEALVNSISLPDFSLIDYKYEVESKRIPKVNESYNLIFQNYCNKIGADIIFAPNLMNKQDIVLPRTAQRLTDIFIRRSSNETDTIIYKIPENFILSSIPEKIEINSQFGCYTAQIINQNNELIYIRNLDLNKGLFPKEEYPQFIDFFDNISEADHLNVVLKRVS